MAEELARLLEELTATEDAIELLATLDDETAGAEDELADEVV